MKHPRRTQAHADACFDARLARRVIRAGPLVSRRQIGLRQIVHEDGSIEHVEKFNDGTERRTTYRPWGDG